MEDTAPVAIGDTSYGVPKDTKGEDCGTSPCGECGNVLSPRQAIVKENAEVAHGVGHGNAKLRVWGPQVEGGEGGTKEV